MIFPTTYPLPLEPFQSSALTLQASSRAAGRALPSRLPAPASGIQGWSVSRMPASHYLPRWCKRDMRAAPKVPTLSTFLLLHWGWGMGAGAGDTIPVQKMLGLVWSGGARPPLT